MGFTKLKYPNMREELIEHLHELSDENYQREVWVQKKSRGSIVHDELDYSIHFLFDDTSLASNPEDEIGVILKNSLEAKLVKNLVDVLNGIFDVYGIDLSDEQYISLPEWSGVIKAASIALEEIN